MPDFQDLYRNLHRYTIEEINNLGEQLDITDENGAHIGHMLAQYGSINVALAVFSARPGLVTQTDNAGHTILHYAAAGKDPKHLITLAKQFPDICAVRSLNGKNTFLHNWAMHHQNIAVVDHFSHIFFITNAFEDSVLHVMVRHCREKNEAATLDVAVKYSAMIQWKNCEGQTCLHYAAKLDKMDLLFKLATIVPANITIQDKWGKSCVHLAAELGDEATINRLIALNQAAATLTRKDGLTAHQILQRNKPYETVPENNSGEKFYENFVYIGPKKTGVCEGAFFHKKVTEKEGLRSLSRLTDKFDETWMIKSQCLKSQTTRYSQEQRAILEVWAGEIYSYYLGEGEVSHFRLIKGRPTHFRANGAHLTVGVKLLHGFKNWGDFLEENNMKSPVTKDPNTGETLLAGKPVRGLAKVLFVSHMLGNSDVHHHNVGFVPVTFKDGREGYEARVIDYDWAMVFTSKSKGLMIDTPADCLLTAQQLIAFTDKQFKHKQYIFDRLLIDQQELTETALRVARLPQQPMKDICHKFESWLKPYRDHQLDNERYHHFPQQEGHVAASLEKRLEHLEFALENHQVITGLCDLFPSDEERQHATNFLQSRTYNISNNSNAWQDYMKRRVQMMLPSPQPVRAM